MTQCDKIVEFMKEHNGITQKDAVYSLSCYRLAARIFDLRKEGYVIDTVKMPNTGYFGTHAKYMLIKDPNEVKEPVTNTTSANDFMNKLKAMLTR